VSLISPDLVAGTLLSRAGQLGETNFRLERVGVRRVLRAAVKALEPGRVRAADPWTSRATDIEAAAVIDCGHRLANDSLFYELTQPRPPRAGDCVAPRSLLEAVLEARRVAASLGAGDLLGRPL
jgi:2,4-dienoyl-CoA reductase (NADPH2)